MPLFLTLFVTKFSAFASTLFGGAGQSLPGVVADKLDPHIAGKLARTLPGGVILVTGTNGKTTTTKSIVAVLEAAGETVLSNTTGSNLKRGITSALIRAASLTGRLPYSMAVFEVDEASLRRISPDLQPKQIVVLNLFRDQLDRYGELDTTAALIGEGIAATQADLLLNADDPLVAHLAGYAQKNSSVAYFGVNDVHVADASLIDTVVDSDRCPVCHRRLTFDHVFYGHIGHYSCPKGDFARPKPLVNASVVTQANLSGTKFKLAINGNVHDAFTPLPGTYNLYNALAAAGVGVAAGVGPDKILATLATTQAAFGRVERIAIAGKTAYVLLIKNPAGFSQIVDTFLAGTHKPNVFFAINDLDADGRDVSWLWDVPLETLVKNQPRVYVSGIRALDMNLRLKYAGISASVAPTLEEGLRMFIEQAPESEDLFILPTYTAMIQVRKVLSKITQIEDVS